MSTGGSRSDRMRDVSHLHNDTSSVIVKERESV